MQASKMNGATSSTATERVHAKAPTYPTRSLRFLEGLKRSSTDSSVESAKLPLDIIISGAGLGGLATAIALARRGHSVTVFEQVQKLGEKVGAGIQVPSNSSRLLLKWGLGPFLGDRVVEPSCINFRRWQSGDVIGYTRLVPEFRESFNAPYYVIHRAHFLDALYRLALKLGVKVRVGSKVKDYNPQTPSLILEDGTTHTADLVIAADGVKSAARALVLGDHDRPPKMTGFAAYRATVDVDRMRADPDLSWLVEKPGINLWIGDMRHVMTYTIAAGKSFNMVLSHPEDSDPSTWEQETAVNDMQQQFSGWDPRLRKIIGMIDSTLKWPLLSGQPLERWVDPSGKFLILGDAAHAMVPYMLQGK
ncbi:hypothetical protein B0A49_01461 [Cryomyces minteri]|uniref:FAD-binding domain-containing protein n=1 Tax=Cryomyces minteri TaxID=331657 RepID=A0A4U0XX49_9PEZI|nr:hypothetical protein B0A49_01461 [Cryomyces minteri]